MKTSNAGNKRSRKPEKVPEKTSEELELEEFLFGKDIIKDRPKNDEDEIEIIIDTAPTQIDSVWHDEEDEEIEIDLTQTNRLKKLRKNDSDPTTVTASELTNALQERFKTRQLDWAKVEDSSTQAQIEERGFDNEDLELLHHSNSLVGRNRLTTSTTTNTSTLRKSAKNKARAAATLYLADDAAPDQPLPAGAINIKRLVNANISEPSNQRITALDFHSNGDLLLVAGEDKNMRFFRIDGDKNEKQLSVKVQDMSIKSAVFRHTTTNTTSSIINEEVILCGRKPFFYTYDIISGNIAKIPGPAGRGLKSLEYMVESPEGRMLAFRGASGYVHICNGATKQWAMEIKQNSAVRAHSFLDETTLVTSGLDAEVYVWDLRKTGRCVARFPHDDGTCTSFLSTYTPPRFTTSTPPHTTTSHPYSSLYHLPRSYIAVGAESGVVSIFGADYNHNTGIYAFQSDTNTTTSTTTIGQPKQLKSILSLTTPITSTCFHPSGQILAIASNQKQNQLKLIHLPTNTVFNNWPTQKTPFQRVECMAFSGKNTQNTSTNGGFFAIGNNTGKVLLYQLNHFGSA